MTEIKYLHLFKRMLWSYIFDASTVIYMLMIHGAKLVEDYMCFDIYGSLVPLPKFVLNHSKVNRPWVLNGLLPQRVGNIVH